MEDTPLRVGPSLPVEFADPNPLAAAGGVFAGGAHDGRGGLGGCGQGVLISGAPHTHASTHKQHSVRNAPVPFSVPTKSLLAVKAWAGEQRCKPAGVDGALACNE